MSRKLIATALLAAAPVLIAPAAASQQSAADLFADAEGKLRLGEVEEARRTYEQLISVYPRSTHEDTEWRAAARVRLGDLLWREGEWQRAGAEYVDVVEFEPPSPWTSRAALRLAYVALAEGDWDSSLQLLQSVVDAANPASDPSSVDAARRAIGLAERFHIRTSLGVAPYRAARTIDMGAEIDRPVALAVSADGQVLLVDEGTPAVFLKDPARDAASRLPYNAHSRPWWGVDGLPYLPTRRAGVIALGGSQLGFMSNDRGRSMPLKDLQAGVRAPDGSWYLLDADPRRVLKFDPDGTYRGMATTASEEPVDLAIDGVGRLYVLERELSRVLRFSSDGQRERVVVASQWRRPEALAVDRLGNTYVVDRDARTIDIFSADGERIHRLGPTLPGNVELRAPRDIAVDDAGRIFVADRNLRAVVVVE